ncbi:MAG TPA: hypothetical protein VKB69_10380 [Micromonosporaceae bacterium]|nr:hypothetical protein [Micromonosporaceae bacterium]
MTGLDGQLSETDGEHNRAVIQAVLDTAGGCVLPPQRIPVDGGLVLGDDRTLAGTSAGSGAVPESGTGAVLVSGTADARPVVHVLGSRTAVRDLTIELPPSACGPHEGARFTALTIGDYLYPDRPEWIEDVTVDRLRVVREAQCPSNSVAVMGAVRGVALRDLDVTGGGTGIAVHWGAVAPSVYEITGPSFHPYRLLVDGLRVRDAYEGFYLSSVHDVDVRDVTCDNVEIGFRLLPGDNTDAYHEDPTRSEVSSRITVAGVRAGWHGIYAIRVAGWGRSEVDREVRRLAYRDVTISGCELTALAATARLAGRTRRAVVVEHADGVRFDGIALGDGAPTGEAMLDGRPAALAELPIGPSRTR